MATAESPSYTDPEIDDRARGGAGMKRPHSPNSLDTVQDERRNKKRALEGRIIPCVHCLIKMIDDRGIFCYEVSDGRKTRCLSCIEDGHVCHPVPEDALFNVVEFIKADDRADHPEDDEDEELIERRDKFGCKALAAVKECDESQPWYGESEHQWDKIKEEESTLRGSLRRFGRTERRPVASAAVAVATSADAADSLTALQQQQTTTQEASAALQQQTAPAREQIASLVVQVDTVKQEIGSLRQPDGPILQEVTNTSTALQTAIQAQNATTQTEIRKTQQTVGTLREHVDATQEQITTVQRQLEAVQDNISSIRQEIKNTRAEYRDAHDISNLLRPSHEVHNLQEAIVTIQEELKATREGMTALLRKVGAARGEIAALDRRVFRVNNRVEVIKDFVDTASVQFNVITKQSAAIQEQNRVIQEQNSLLIHMLHGIAPRLSQFLHNEERADEASDP